MIEIKPITTNQRSNEENRYFHGVIVNDIAEFKRWKPSTAKRWIKHTWGIDSTAWLTTVQFEELCENVRVHVLKYWGLKIYLPNE